MAPQAQAQAQIPVPYLLDFYPLQAEDQTRIAPFFAALKEGRFTTTRCTKCQALHWQPRAVCPDCLGDQLAWVDLPKQGTLFAFTSLERGAPLGMEHDTPFCIGVVELDAPGRRLRILSRLDDARFDQLRIGQAVGLKVLNLPDGRVFYRFAPAP